jgi:large subunit ribosomal protein L4
MEAPLYNQQGEKIGTLPLSEKLFGARWNPDLVHEVVTVLAASRRRGTAHTKGRGEVSGGGKKPWRQKGTGRARHGSTRSPIWVGGGVTHGPRSEKKYGGKINIAARRKALAVILSKKLKDNEIFFVDQISFEEAKTKIARGAIEKFAGSIAAEKFAHRGGRTLFLIEKPDTVVIRAMRNLPYVTVEEARNINVEKALTPKYVVITKEALSKIKI